VRPVCQRVLHLPLIPAGIADDEQRFVFSFDVAQNAFSCLSDILGDIDSPFVL
jgi:hypothetical protein